MLDKKLLALLACPLCKGKLTLNAKKQELICRFDQLAFPIQNEIPVMLVSQARQLDESENT